jgi:hypothetical protein
MNRPGESRIVSLSSCYPIGFLGRFSRKSLETLGFPGKMRKRHAETTKPSGKYGLIVVRCQFFVFRFFVRMEDGNPNYVH